jgi:hypothetical protein
LPGPLRIAEIDLHIRGYREVFVFGHLQSAVPGQRAFQRSGEFTNVLTQSRYHRFGLFAGHLDQHGKARMTQSYIKSDIAGFRERFNNGVVREEAVINLPRVKTAAPVYTFESNDKHNSFEQIIYISELNGGLHANRFWGPMIVSFLGSFLLGLRGYHLASASLAGSLVLVPLAIGYLKYVIPPAIGPQVPKDSNLRLK